MNILKMLNGIARLASFLCLITITLPITLCLFAYDIGHPQDGKDRALNFMDGIITICGIE